MGLSIYLAGAIRDTNFDEDIQWREDVIDAIKPMYPDVLILNPVGDKTFNRSTKEWKMGGRTTTAHGIVAQDLWSVRRADLIVANITSLASGYPSIGTVMEMGAAAALGKLIYSIMDPNYSGSPNPGVFKVHPFLSEISSEVFPSVDDCIAFLLQHVGMLKGEYAKFGGTVEN